MSSYPKVKEVVVLPGKRLRVTFVNGATRIYDCSPLLGEAAFSILANDAFFRTAQADAHGYGVVWSDEIDLSESELWVNGGSEYQDVEPLTAGH